MRRALEVRLATRSPGHASIVESRAALARALRTQGRDGEAGAVEENAARASDEDR